MSVKALRCPVCGAQVSREKDICDYCNTHYIIEDEKVVLLGDYRGCNVYKELIKEYPDPEKKSYIDYKRFEKYCKHCHIKNCPFFGKETLKEHFEEVVKRTPRY
jgi:hypothetical protein